MAKVYVVMHGNSCEKAEYLSVVKVCMTENAAVHVIDELSEYDTFYNKVHDAVYRAEELYNRNVKKAKKPDYPAKPVLSLSLPKPDAWKLFNNEMEIYNTICKEIDDAFNATLPPKMDLSDVLMPFGLTTDEFENMKESQYNSDWLFYEEADMVE